MPSRWLYQVNGTQHGPVSSRELAELARRGGLRPDDLVRKEGAAEWQLAGKVKGLFPATEPPPSPPAVADMDKLIGLDLPSLVNHFREKAAAAAQRVEAVVSGSPGQKAAPTQPRPGIPDDQTAATPPQPAGAGGHGRPPAPTPAGEGEETGTAAQLLARIERFLQRVYDTSIPVAGLDTELAELHRAVERRQACLRELLEQNERDRREGERHAAALREAVRLKTLAQEARDGGRPAEADRLLAEARRVVADVPRRTREEREAELARQRERLEQLRGEGEVMAGAADLLRQAVADIERRRQIEGLTRPQPAAAPPPVAANPNAGFGAWYARAFGLLVSGPPAVSWPFQAALWTLGLGFLWIPMLYLAGKSLSCPGCGLLWVRTTEGEKLLDRQRGFGQVTREDSHYDREGRYVGGTRRTEQVVVNNDLVRVHYACKSCGHRWTETERRQTEA